MIMKHRIFIAINLPDKIKGDLAKYELIWPSLPCRWTKTDNIHITLFFLGYLSDEEVFEVSNRVKNGISDRKPFNLRLNRIIYGPPKQPAKMIWAVGELSEELMDLQAKLEYSILESGISYRKDKRPYSFHITLGRLRMWDFRAIDPEERPQIDEEIDLSFPVNSIELMESELRKSGPEHTIVESFKLAPKSE